MRAIAARLGVSATALYQHFESKAAILREIRFLGVRTLQEAQAPALDLEDPVARVTELARRYIDFALGNPWLYKVLFYEEEIDWDKIDAEERDRLLVPLQQARDAVEKGVRDGAFRSELDLDSTALLLWASVHGLASLIINGRISEVHPAFPVPDQEAFVRSFVESLVRSFRR